MFRKVRIMYAIVEMVELSSVVRAVKNKAVAVENRKRETKLLFTLQQQDISCRGLQKRAGHWCNGLILRLLQITHRQWTFRNGTVHLRGPDGLTSAQHDEM